MILVDASVLIQFLRTKEAKIDGLLRSLPVAVCGVTRADVLAGARNSQERQHLTTFLQPFQHVAIADSTWDLVGENLAALYAKGIVQKRTASKMPSHPSSLAPVRPKRKRWWLRWIVLPLLGLMLTLIIQFFVRSHLGQRELDEAIAETVALDPDWAFESLQAKRKLVPPERNGATKVMEAARALDAESLADPALTKPLEALPVERRLNAQQEVALFKVLGKNARALELSRALDRFPEGRYAFEVADDVFSTKVPQLEDLKKIQRLLELDVVGHLHNEDVAAAHRSCLALVNASRSIGDELFMIVHFQRWSGFQRAVASIERVLGQAKLGDEQLVELQQTLADEMNDNQISWLFRGERAGLSKFIDGVRLGEYSLERASSRIHGDHDWELSDWLLYFLKPDLYPKEQANLLRVMNAYVAATSVPLHEQWKATEQIERGLDRQRLLVRVFFGPYLRRVVAGNLAHHTYLRCAHAAVAAERFRLMTGAWPDSLKVLVERGLLPEMPLDPFDGQPLRLSLRDDSAVIYSVYSNGIDDGAKSFRFSGSTAPPDWGFQLWIPPLRRGPPQPEPDAPIEP